MHYLSAADLAGAIRLRAETGFPILAGGTDLYPAIENGACIDGMIDVSRVSELRGPIRRDGDAWTIPALATWSDVIAATLPPQFDALKQAAAEVGGRQIQNTGTVGGNLCNASPAADGIVALLALDASAVLHGGAGTRALPLDELILGNRRTALRPDEVLTAVRVPAANGRHVSIFRKLGARRYLVISIAMVAAFVELDAAGRVCRAGIAVGACADRALRLAAAEPALLGIDAASLASYELPDAALATLAPIDDIRGTAVYRRHAVKALVEEAMHDISRGLRA